jgi:hypothetical protein
MPVLGVAIPLLHQSTVYTENGWILECVVGRPCKTGTLAKELMAWELDDATVAVGYDSPKAGPVPLRLRISQTQACSGSLQPFFIQSRLLNLESACLATIQAALQKQRTMA